MKKKNQSRGLLPANCAFQMRLTIVKDADLKEGHKDMMNILLSTYFINITLSCMPVPGV